MNREEILAMSREENKNMDLVQYEVGRKGTIMACAVMYIMSLVFYVIYIFALGKYEFGFFAPICAFNLVQNIYSARYAKKKNCVLIAVIWGIALAITLFGFVASLLKTLGVL